MRSTVAALVLLAAGCGDDVAPTDSGRPDAGPPDAPPDTGVLVAIPDPALLPVLTPCPDGWATVEPDDGSPTRCDPFPAPPSSPCPPDEAAFVGEAGCTAVGPACPVDGWPADLPAGRPIVYVRADAPVSGDGTIGAPLTSVQAAVAASPSGGVVAIAPGVYRESVVIDLADVDLVGACLDAVIEGEEGRPVVTARRTTATVQNLRLVGGTEGLSISEANVELRAVVTEPGATASLTGLSILTGSSVTAESLVIRGPVNVGVAARTSSLALDRVVIDGSTRDAVSVGNSTLVARDFAIRRYGLQVSAGTGIFSSGPSVVTLERAAIVQGYGEPILSADTSRVSVTDAVIVGPALDQPAPLGGIGSIGPGASLDLERVYVARLRDGGLVAAVDTTFTARDLVVVDSVPSEGRDFGYGVEVAAATTATLERVYIARSSILGLLADGAGTVVDVSDLTIVDTAPNVIGTFGRAVQVQNGATLNLTRADLRGNLEAGVVVARPGSRLDAEHVRISETDQRRCSAEGGSCAAAGVGLGVYEEGAATLERFLVQDSFLTGVQIASDGELDMAYGVVERNPVGANVQVSGYDVTRLTTEVVYRDNGVNLDAEELPVPEATTSIGGP